MAKKGCVLLFVTSVYMKTHTQNLYCAMCTSITYSLIASMHSYTESNSLQSKWNQAYHDDNLWDFFLAEQAEAEETY